MTLTRTTHTLRSMCVQGTFTYFSKIVVFFLRAIFFIILLVMPNDKQLFKTFKYTTTIQLQTFNIVINFHDLLWIALLLHMSSKGNKDLELFHKKTGLPYNLLLLQQRSNTRTAWKSPTVDPPKPETTSVFENSWEKKSQHFLLHFKTESFVAERRGREIVK